jgi:asparagine synthase (glutamine-hydrolysing)
MSGIVAVVNLDGAPVDRSLLERMTGALAFRAPDGGAAWSEGRAGLGHALLRTSPAQRIGPATLDGRSWIVADARIDARDELLPALRAAGERVEPDADDPALLLHAYRAWGERAPERLLGDFAFAIWDAERRRLFCARDPFGVRLLYHARVGDAVIVGNTLEVVLMHPALADAPDDLAVADYLLFGAAQDPAATAFAAVRALPPAHALMVEEGHASTRRYRELPLEGEIHYRRVEEYVEHFRTLLTAAVADRLRGLPAGIMMSGGRDSTAIAAAAVWAGEGAEIRARTMVYRRLMPDREGEYAALAAGVLGIPLDLHPVDGYRLLGRWDHPDHRRPEPTDSTVLGAGSADYLRAMAAHAPVALTGQGADAALAESRSRLLRLAGRGRLFRALREAAAYTRWHRRLARPGVRSWYRERTGRVWRPPFPAWIAPELSARLRLEERWAERIRPPASSHPLRPEAHARLSDPGWARLLEQYDPGVSRVPVECRHPFFDLRLVSFVLAIPPAQWYNDKGLLRIALRGVLPRAFLRRPKTPLAGDPIVARLEVYGERDLARTHLAPGIGRWVDPTRLPRFAGGGAEGGAHAEAWLHLRPLNLSIWLERLTRDAP